VEPGATMLKRALIGLIGWYQRWFSPLLGDHCRFEPSCSEYARAALTEWGLIRGAALIIWRLVRCQPFCRGGLDPVPRAPDARQKSLGIPHG